MRTTDWCTMQQCEANVNVAAVVNIPDGAANGTDHIIVATTSPSKVARIASFTASDGNRRRRKPFKSNSNHSLKGLQSQMMTSHSHDPAKGLHFGAVHASGSGLHGSQHGSHHSHDAYGSYESHGSAAIDAYGSAPVHGSNARPAQSDGSGGAGPHNEHMNGIGSHDVHVNGDPHGFISHAGPIHGGFDDSPTVGRVDDSPPRGRTDGMFDDGVSSVADSVGTYATTSSNTGVSPIPADQKRLMRFESHTSRV